MFGKGSSPEHVDQVTVNVGEAQEDATSTSSSSSAAPSTTAVSKKEPIPLEIEATFTSLPPMSFQEKRRGRDR